MKKLLLKTMLLLCALVAGMSSAWAETTTYQHVFTAKPSTGSDIVLSSVKWNVAATNLGSYNSGNYAGVQIGSKSNNGSITLTSSSAWGAESGTTYEGKTKITEVRLWLNLGGTSVTPTVTIGGKPATSDGTTVTKNSSAGDDWTKATKVTFTPAAGGDKGQVVINVETVKAGYICCVEIDCETPPAAAVATPTFSVTGGTYTTAQNVELNCATDGATIRYTLDGTEPTESSTAYSSAIAVATTTTIKAKAFKGEDASDVVTATYTILPILHAGTSADPYTVADARNAIDANTGLENVYVSGIVCEGGSSLSSGAMIYWISDDGSETDKFEIYKGKGLSGANFTAESDVQVGDVVVVYGTITKYNSIYEFGTGSQLYSLDRPVVPTILTTPAAISELAYVTGNGPSAAQTFTVSGSNLTADITLALSGSDFEMSLSEGSGYTNSLTLTQTAGAVAETTVYVRLKEGLEINDYAGTITLTSAGATDKTIDLTGEVTPTIFTWDLSKKEYTTETDLVTWTSSYATMTNATATGGTSATNYLGGDDNNRTSSRFYGNNTLTITPASGYMITSVVFTATSENYASALANSTWTNATATASEKTVTVTPTNGVSAITATIGATCGFTAVKVYYQTATATINLAAACTDGDKCYGTYSNSSAFIVPADLTVYEVSVIGGELLLDAYATDDVVPANTGVLVAGTAGDHDVTLTTGGTSKLDADNMLRASGAGINAAAMATADTGCKFYRLTMHEGTQIGFFWGAEDGAAFDVAANKAYLAVPDGETGAVPVRGFNLNDGADAISEIMKNEKTSAIYDLSGRRVVKATKGLYIVNGKKVVK